MAKSYPHPQLEVADFVALAADEIIDGSSEEHECELAKKDVDELISREVKHAN
jgi:hypothetical protein